MKLADIIFTYIVVLASSVAYFVLTTKLGWDGDDAEAIMPWAPLILAPPIWLIICSPSKFGWHQAAILFPAYIAAAIAVLGAMLLGLVLSIPLSYVIKGSIETHFVLRGSQIPEIVSIFLNESMAIVITFELFFVTAAYAGAWSLAYRSNELVETSINGDLWLRIANWKSSLRQYWFIFSLSIVLLIPAFGICLMAIETQHYSSTYIYFCTWPVLVLVTLSYLRNQAEIVSEKGA